MKILKFSALWCADCIVMRPMWQEINKKFPDLEIIEVDFDDQPEIAKKYGVKKVPLFIFLNSREEEISRLKGLQNKPDLVKLIEDNLSN